MFVRCNNINNAILIRRLVHLLLSVLLLLLYCHLLFILLLQLLPELLGVFGFILFFNLKHLSFKLNHLTFLFFVVKFLQFFTVLPFYQSSIIVVHLLKMLSDMALVKKLFVHVCLNDGFFHLLNLFFLSFFLSVSAILFVLGLFLVITAYTHKIFM